MARARLLAIHFISFELARRAAPDWDSGNASPTVKSMCVPRRDNIGKTTQRKSRSFQEV